MLRLETSAGPAPRSVLFSTGAVRDVAAGPAVANPNHPENAPKESGFERAGHSAVTFGGSASSSAVLHASALLALRADPERMLRKRRTEGEAEEEHEEEEPHADVERIAPCDGSMDEHGEANRDAKRRTRRPLARGGGVP